MENDAKLNITWAGQNGDLADPVHAQASDGDVKQWATEAVRNGSVRGIAADPAADFADFVVDRFPATEDLPPRLVLRPKTPFGFLAAMAMIIRKRMPFQHPTGCFCATCRVCRRV